MTTPELKTAAGASAVEHVFATVAQLLMKQGRVEIDGFGAFELHRRKPRRARNPRTGERINIPARTVVKFKPAAVLKREAEQRSDAPDGT